MRAPASLAAVHPLGKSPVIDLDGIIVAESGAIVECLCEQAGRLVPAPGTPERAAFLEWLHFAEGSAMPPILLDLLSMFMGEAATAGVLPFFAPERDRVLGHLNNAVAVRPYLLPSGFSGADVMNGYVIFAANHVGRLGAYPGLVAYRDRLLARPALQRALVLGGPMFPDRVAF